MGTLKNRDVIIACDFKSAADLTAFLSRFGDTKPYLKVGMELFYAAGPQVVRDLKAQGYRVFLDLKLHDIPNTVKGAMRSLLPLGVDMINVHASGAIPMMEAAMEAVAGVERRPLVIAVTQLTSTSEARMHEDLCIAGSVEDVVAHYAKNAKRAGLDGVVCSPLEAALVRQVCGDAFVTVTPGVRFAGGDVADQSRVTTPAQAREIGSHFIVVGRPITAADDPVAAYQRCVKEFV